MIDMVSPTGVSRSRPHPAGPGGGHRRGPRGPWGFVEAAGWLVLATAASTVVPQLGPTGDRWANGVLGVLCWCLGNRIFLGHGGPLLTPQSIFGFAFSIFFGVGGVYHTVLAEDYVQPWLRPALTIGFVAQLAIFFGFWRGRGTTPGRLPQIALLSAGSGGGVAAVGLIAFTVAVLVKARYPGSPQLQGLALGTAFSGITLTTVTLVLHERARLLSVRTLGVVALLALFVQYVHIGTGRLLIAALGLALAIVYALRFHTMIVKYAVIVVTGPVLWWMAQERLAYIDTLATGSSLGRTGLESAVRPPHGFAELFYAYQAGGFTPSGGRSFLSVPAMFVPDWLWADKPLALGYEIARVTAPAKFGTGYSDASSMLGEWLFNFGYLGLLLMVPALGLGIPLLDRLMARCLRIQSDTIRLLALSTAVILCAGVPDVVWSGTHTYGARTLLRLPLLLVPLLLAAVPAIIRGNGRRGHQPAFPDGRGGDPGGDDPGGPAADRLAGRHQFSHPRPVPTSPQELATTRGPRR